jgi:carboxyl-terminal processing protease
MIQLAQTTLKLAGFNPGRTDGVFDAQTSTAIRQYQVAQKIPVSGLLDEPTRRVLLPGAESASED